jgi:dihydrofolate reductase
MAMSLSRRVRHSGCDEEADMAKLIYTAIASLDGFTEDASGGFEWAAPDEQVHAYVNDLERPIGTYLYGRRMYETMRFWETEGDGPDDGEVSADFAHLWRAADKVVYSASMAEPDKARTRLERDFDPAAIARLKQASQRDIGIGGPTIASAAFRAGLIDECHLFLHPIVIGSGKRALPDDARIRLELLDERRFESGVVHLHYAVRN